MWGVHTRIKHAENKASCRRDETKSKQELISKTRFEKIENYLDKLYKFEELLYAIMECVEELVSN